MIHIRCEELPHSVVAVVVRDDDDNEHDGDVVCVVNTRMPAARRAAAVRTALKQALS